jgi:hypothetical protein
MTIPAPSPRLKPPLSTRDLLIIVAIVALMTGVGWPIVEQKMKPRVESSALARIEPPLPGKPSGKWVLDEQACLSKSSDYLRSPQAVQDVLRDTAVLSLPSRPSAAVVERCLRERIRIEFLAGTFLMRCSVTVDEPARDTAILNAAESALMKQQLAGPRGVTAIIELGKPPMLRAIPFRSALAAMFSLVILGLTLAAFASVRSLGGYISRARHPGS